MTVLFISSVSRISIFFSLNSSSPTDVISLITEVFHVPTIYSYLPCPPSPPSASPSSPPSVTQSLLRPPLSVLSRVSCLLLVHPFVVFVYPHLLSPSGGGRLKGGGCWSRGWPCSFNNLGSVPWPEKGNWQAGAAGGVRWSVGGSLLYSEPKLVSFNFGIWSGYVLSDFFFFVLVSVLDFDRVAIFCFSLI